MHMATYVHGLRSRSYGLSPMTSHTSMNRTVTGSIRLMSCRITASVLLQRFLYPSSERANLRLAYSFRLMRPPSS